MPWPLLVRLCNDELVFMMMMALDCLFFVEGVAAEEVHLDIGVSFISCNGLTVVVFVMCSI